MKKLKYLERKPLVFMQVLYLVELEFKMLVFAEGGKSEIPKIKNPRSKASTNTKPNPHDTGLEPSPGHIFLVNRML